MGGLFVEVGLRLHFLPPIESKAFTDFLYELKAIWEKLEGQSSETDVENGKRSKKKETVLPIGSNKARSRSTLALASKRKRAERMIPFLRVKKQKRVMHQDAI